MSSAMTTDEDDDLVYVRGKRKELIDHLCKSGLPADPKDQRTLLTALKDMSSDTLAKRRLDLDSGVGNKTAEAVAVIAEILASNQARLLSGRVDDPQQQRSGPPKLSEEIVPTNIVPGELTPGRVNDSYQEFVRRQQARTNTSDEEGTTQGDA